jgi:hypothetical protein
MDIRKKWKQILCAVIPMVAILVIVVLVKAGIPVSNTEDRLDILEITVSVGNYIDSIVKKNQIIEAIQVVTINFQSNVRLDTSMNINDIMLQDIYNGFTNNKIVDTPVFTEEKENNQRILKLINGEFLCIPFRESSAYKYAPQAEQFVKHVCAIGIPPTPAGFSGILVLYLKTTPSADEKANLFFFARELSAIITEDNVRNGFIKQR